MHFSLAQTSISGLCCIFYLQTPRYPTKITFLLNFSTVMENEFSNFVFPWGKMFNSWGQIAREERYEIETRVGLKNKFSLVKKGIFFLFRPTK